MLIDDDHPSRFVGERVVSITQCGRGCALLSALATFKLDESGRALAWLGNTKTPDAVFADPAEWQAMLKNQCERAKRTATGEEA